VIDDESEGGDYDAVICAGWGVPWLQDKGERNDEVDGTKKEADSAGKVVHNVKERLVVYNEEDTDGRATCRVTRDEERVLPVDGTEISLCR